VDVDAAEARQVEYRLRENEAIGRDNHGLGADGAHTFPGCRILQLLWLINFDSGSQRQCLDWRSVQQHTSS
jgi:hypothetical protein